jgi:hypothetical protein
MDALVFFILHIFLNEKLLILPLYPPPKGELLISLSLEK